MARILIAEDEQALRFWMSTALRVMGYEIVDTADGRAAWNCLQRDQRFDLVITDVQMPHMNGIELAERISQAHPQLPIMIITAFSEPRSEIVHEGQYPFLIKPTTHQQLIATVKKIIGQPGT